MARCTPPVLLLVLAACGGSAPRPAAPEPVLTSTAAPAPPASAPSVRRVERGDLATLGLVHLPQLDATGEWSGFSGTSAQVSVDDDGRTLRILVGGVPVFNSLAPWFTDPMPDMQRTHPHGACSDEGVEIMAAWVVPDQRRALLLAQVDFPPCAVEDGLYLIAW
ncbi:MAG: hypothetical protein JWP01_3401 [Myxococcales bacterium]|nr:hypothetical protein [Myxococcales bacterium]